MDTPRSSRLEEIIREYADAEVELLREELAQNSAQLAALKAEDQGWTNLFGDGPEGVDEGMTLDKIKEWSRVLREAAVGSPLVKQANNLRFSYTFTQPFIIPNLKDTVETRPGRPSATPDITRFYHDAVNQRYIFGKEAQELISTACSTDSMYLALGDNGTKRLRPIPLYQIDAVSVNPDFPGEVWAYLRSWVPDPAKQEKRRRWYYTDRFEGTREKSLEAPGGTKRIPVDSGKTMIDFVVNQQVGWTFGSADLMAGHAWNRKYITMMNHGEEVSAALAHFAWLVKRKSPKGAKDSGVTIANSRGGPAGNTALMGEGNEMGALSSARTAYDFSALRDVIGVYAASVGVSVVDLLASPAASGSSYGAASALAPAARRGIEARRSQLAAWMERVCKWGTGEDIKITPASIEEVEPYRREQMLMSAFNSGLIHWDEIRPELLYINGLVSLHAEPPEGFLMPNNEASLPRKDIDTDATTPTGTTNPDQGQSTGAGTGGDSNTSNDLRDDTIS